MIAVWFSKTWRQLQSINQSIKGYGQNSIFPPTKI